MGLAADLDGHGAVLIDGGEGQPVRPPLVLPHTALMPARHHPQAGGVQRCIIECHPAGDEGGDAVVAALDLEVGVILVPRKLAADEGRLVEALAQDDLELRRHQRRHLIRAPTERSADGGGGERRQGLSPRR